MSTDKSINNRSLCCCVVYLVWTKSSKSCHSWERKLFQHSHKYLHKHWRKTKTRSRERIAHVFSLVCLFVFSAKNCLFPLFYFKFMCVFFSNSSISLFSNTRWQKIFIEREKCIHCCVDTSMAILRLSWIRLNVLFSIVVIVVALRKQHVKNMCCCCTLN